MALLGIVVDGPKPLTIYMSSTNYNQWAIKKNEEDKILGVGGRVDLGGVGGRMGGLNIVKIHTVYMYEILKNNKNIKQKYGER